MATLKELNEIKALMEALSEATGVNIQTRPTGKGDNVTAYEFSAKKRAAFRISTSDPTTGKKIERAISTFFGIDQNNPAPQHAAYVTWYAADIRDLQNEQSWKQRDPWRLALNLPSSRQGRIKFVLPEPIPPLRHVRTSQGRSYCLSIHERLFQTRWHSARNCWRRLRSSDKCASGKRCHRIL